MERYLSTHIIENNHNKIKPKVFYWNDNRAPLDQVEKVEGLKESLKGPLARGEFFRSKKTIFKNKRDFYEKIWVNEDFEKFDKLNPFKAKRINDLCNFI